MTTRRLAEGIGRSQPVLYGHFPDGKVGIVRAVALQGFRELVEVVALARRQGDDRQAVRSIVEAYLAFAEDHPALYEAMFSMPLGLAFGEESAPPELKDAFGALRDGFAGDSFGSEDTETLTEVAWSAMHGIVVLTRDGRLRESARDARVTALVEVLTATA